MAKIGATAKFLRLGFGAMGDYEHVAPNLSDGCGVEPETPRARRDS